MGTNTVSTFNRRDKSLAIIQQGLLLVGMLSIVLLIPKSWVTFWDYPKMIIVHIVAMLSLLISIIKGGNRSLDILDLSILFFVSWQFLSYTWSQYPGLVWYEAFHWLILMGIYFVVRKTDFSLFSKKLWGWVFLAAMVFNYVVLGYFHFEQFISSGTGLHIRNLVQIHAYLGHNCNFISAILVILVPLYGIVIKWLSIRPIIAWPLISIHSFFILICNSRASAFALLIVGIIFFACTEASRRKAILKIVFPIIGILSIFYISILEKPKEFVLKFNPIVSITEESGDERMELWRRSVKLMIESPLRGHGANSWQVQHMKYGYSDIKLAKTRNTQYVHAHNMILETGAELGFVGLINLLIIFVIPFYWLYLDSKGRHSKYITTSLILSFLSFIIISSFYGITYTNHRNFGSLDILFLIILGLSTRKGFTSNLKRHIPVAFILFVGISFCYKCYIYDNYKKLTAISALKRSNVEPALISEKVQDIYHPTFYEYNDNRPIKRIEAQNLWKQKRYSEAIGTMHQVIRNHHYNVHNWMLLGDMYIAVGDSTNAIESYVQCMEINGNFLKPRMKLAQLSLNSNNWNLFDQSISFYYEDLLPSFEKLYSEHFWEQPQHDIQLRFWKERCQEIDIIQGLIQTKNLLIATNLEE